MKKITVLIKPVSSMCNMECSYCFYKDLKKYNQHNIGKMTCETCCSIVEKTLSYSVEPIEIEYCFQGGEPLLAGIEFYNFFIELVKEKNKDHIIRYSIQTNGILLNDKWISLFKKNDFLVGISLDGIKKTHDHSRKIKCSGSFEEVIKSVQLLKKNDVNFNVLSVITPYMIKFAKEIYKFYCEEGFDYVQFIPCLPSLDGGEGLLPQQYFEFYKNLYDEYRKNSCLHISLFDQISNLINGEKKCSCGMLGYCSFQIVIEFDGNIYPCDFFVLDRYCLGNINNITLKNAMKKNTLTIFLSEDKNFSFLCDECEFYTICQGNCKRQNVCMFNDTYCGYQELLKYILNNK